MQSNKGLQSSINWYQKSLVLLVANIIFDSFLLFKNALYLCHVQGKASWRIQDCGEKPLNQAHRSIQKIVCNYKYTTLNFILFFFYSSSICFSNKWGVIIVYFIDQWLEQRVLPNIPPGYLALYIYNLGCKLINKCV